MPAIPQNVSIYQHFDPIGPDRPENEPRKGTVEPRYPLPPYVGRPSPMHTPAATGTRMAGIIEPCPLVDHCPPTRQGLL